jgi:terminase small subunit / prophage DNA-packing protein
MSTIASVTELADLFGVDRRTVSGVAKRGIILRSGRGFDRDDSVRRYCAHLRELATGRGGEVAIAGATVERARLLKEQADAVALKNATLRGEMLVASEVEATWAGMLRTVRAGMLAVPSRCAGRLPNLTRQDVSEIDREVRAVLTELGGGNADS